MDTQAAAPFGRVLIVDDHPFFSRGLAEGLLHSGKVSHVDTVERNSAAQTYLDRHPDTDLVMLDMKLPDEQGLGLLQFLEDKGLPIPVVVVSSREDEGVIRTARDAGALGYLPKSASAAALRQMLQRIQRGEPYFSLPDRYVAQTDNGLTPRQKDVLRLLATGLPNKKICSELGLTEHTIKTHLKTIFSTLNVRNRTSCVATARDMGLVN